jgi:hypothetical protein
MSHFLQSLCEVEIELDQRSHVIEEKCKQDAEVSSEMGRLCGVHWGCNVPVNCLKVSRNARLAHSPATQPRKVQEGILVKAKITHLGEGTV